MASDDTDDFTLLDGAHATAAITRRALTIPAGGTLTYIADEWADAIVVLEFGMIELEARSGRRQRFAEGSVLSLADLPLTAIHNPDARPAVLMRAARNAPPPTGATAMSHPTEITATGFLDELERLADPERPTKAAGGFRSAPGDQFLAVRMRDVFALAKRCIDLPLEEVEALLESPVHEARVGAVSVMDFQARRKQTPPQHRAQLFDLYLRRHDRIDNWDLVDRAAIHVVGGYLADKPRHILSVLAASTNVWERRTAIVSTAFFIRSGDLDDTFAIADRLVDDEHEMIHTAVGGWLREAGKKEPDRLRAFLDTHAATMPRIALRFAIEHFDGDERKRYLAMARARPDGAMATGKLVFSAGR